MSDSSPRKHGKSTKLAPIDDSSLKSGEAINNMKLTSSDVRDKKGLIEAARRLAPAGVNPAPVIFWDVEGNLKNVNIDSSNVKQQVQIVEGGINLSVKKFNDLKDLCDIKTKILKKKLDDMEGIKREAENLEAMFKAETEEGKRIVILQDEATKVETSICKKQHQTRVYQHMLERLRRNQLKYDAHLNGMQATLADIEKEGVEVRHLRRDLDAGLAKAQSVFDDTRQLLSASRTDREVLIAQRRNEVKTAQNLQSWLKQRDQSKLDLALALRGDLSKDEKSFLKKELRDKEERTKKLQNQNAENHSKLAKMEEEFQELKQVTGAQDVSVMVSKFSDQATNKKNLEKEVKEAEKKIAGLRKEYAVMEKSYQELLTTGAGQAEFGREHVKKLEAEIENKTAAIRLLNSSNERTESIMIGLKQGAKGLLQRTSVYSYLLREPGVFDLTGGGSPQQPSFSEDASWTDTLDALNTSESICAKLMEINASVGEAPAKGDDDDQSYESSLHSLETGMEAPAFSLNVRIKSQKILREEELKALRDDSYNPHQNQMTSTVMQLLASGAADSPVRQNVDTDDELDDDQSYAQVATTNKKKHHEDVESAPSRHAVKKSSVHSVNEAHRREDMEKRKIALAARLASRNTGGGDDDEKGIADAARLTAQRESAKKLSTFPQPPTLPPGTTLRDDAMTKTKAFLEHKPDEFLT